MFQIQVKLNFLNVLCKFFLVNNTFSKIKADMILITKRILNMTSQNIILHLSSLMKEHIKHSSNTVIVVTQNSSLKEKERLYNSKVLQEKECTGLVYQSLLLSIIITITYRGLHFSNWAITLFKKSLDVYKMKVIEKPSWTE